MRRAPLLATLAAAALAAAGCGYRLGFEPPQGVQTVAVPIFENRTGLDGRGSWRELELDLTRAVIREVQRRTPLHVVEVGRADLVLRGELLRIGQRVLVQGEQRASLLSSAEVEVRVRIEEPDGAVRTERRLIDIAELSPGLLIAGTPQEAIQPAAEEAFQKLAERIVMLLERR